MFDDFHHFFVVHRISLMILYNQPWPHTTLAICSRNYMYVLKQERLDVSIHVRVSTSIIMIMENENILAYVFYAQIYIDYIILRNRDLA